MQEKLQLTCNFFRKLFHYSENYGILYLDFKETQGFM